MNTFICTPCKLDKHVKCAVLQDGKVCDCEGCVMKVGSKAQRLIREADARYALAKKE